MIPRRIPNTLFSSSKGLIFWIIILLLTSSHPSLAQTGKNKVLAEIDGRAITVKEFTSYLSLFKGNPSYLPKTKEEKERMLNHLIDRALLLEAAKKEGYDKRETLKKHPSLSPLERETFMLRAYLMDHVSRKVSISQQSIKTYQFHHPGLTRKQAMDTLIAQQEQRLFEELMRHLKGGHNIRIYPDNF